MTNLIARLLKQLQPKPVGFTEWERFAGLGFVHESNEPPPMSSAELTLTLKRAQQ